MPIDKQQLGGLTHEVDQLHHGSRQLGEEDGDGIRPSRRNLLTKAGVGGALLTVGAMAGPVSRFLPAALAKGLNDSQILEFLAGMEFAVVAAYQAALDSGKLDASARRLATSFQAHHRDHGRAFNTILQATTEEPNAKVVAVFSPRLKAAKDQNALLKIAYTIEERAAATDLFVLGALEDPTNAQAAATVLPVESQHAVVLAQMLNQKIGTYMPSFQNTQQTLDPATYSA